MRVRAFPSFVGKELRTFTKSKSNRVLTNSDVSEQSAVQ